MDAEFRIKHTMDKRLYKIMHCPFCGDDLNEENEDFLEEYEDVCGKMSDYCDNCGRKSHCGTSLSEVLDLVEMVMEHHS